MRHRRPRFYFSFRSPYSWLAAHELEQRHALGPAELDYVPYYEPDPRSAAQLEARGGSFGYREMSKERRLYILQDVRRLTRARGLEIRWPQDLEPWWEAAHLGYLWAKQLGRAHEFFWAVCRARWQQGRDIGRRETILELAVELDLEADALARALELDELRAAGIDGLLAAARDGVFGVPFFVAGFERFWGQDRVDDFVAHLRGSSTTDVTGTMT